MGANRTFDLFLSHASEDEAWTEILALRLKERGIRVWFDKWEMHGGDNVITILNEALAASRQMAAVWTVTYFNPHKRWTLAESTSREHANIQGSQRLLIPILREECKVTPLLSAIKTIDFRDDARFEEAVNELLGALLSGDPPASDAPAPAGEGRAVAFHHRPEAAVRPDPFQKWMEFITALVCLLVLFLSMLGFSTVLVCRDALCPGIVCGAGAFVTAVCLFGWLIARGRRGEPVGRQEFAFVSNATEQIQAHRQSARATAGTSR